MDVGEGDLKYALKHDIVNATRHEMYKLMPEPLLTQLRQKSEQRVSKDKEFVDLIRRIDLYVAQKEQATVSLNEEKFMKRRAELDAQKEEEKKELELDGQDGKDVVFRDNYYNREVMNITSDYIDGLQKQDLARR